MNKKIFVASLLAISLFTGCGEVKPSLSDAVQGSYKVHNGMTMDEVKKVMKMDPTGQEKIGDRVVWRYEGNIKKDDDSKITYNNVTIIFDKGIVTNSGTFSCNLPKVIED
jgi:major membrane immunogen (membrane-anchored lipoprotein)